MSDETKEILDKLEIASRKHTIKVCEDSSKIETMPASVVDELRLSSFSAELLLDYITNLQEEIKSTNESITWWQNRFNAIEKNIKELQQKVQQYENPDDLTLFYMWLDAKAKDKMKELETINTSLKQTNAMLSLLGRDYKSRCENAKIYIKEHSNNLVEYLDVFEVKDLLEILEGSEGIK